MSIYTLYKCTLNNPYLHDRQNILHIEICVNKTYFTLIKDSTCAIVILHTDFILLVVYNVRR